MLISKLGQTRMKLLDSFTDLSDDQLNQSLDTNTWTISQVIQHLSTMEKETSALILDALETKSDKVAEKDLSFITDRSQKVQASDIPMALYVTKNDLMQLLEESRFQHLQYIFNETHERTLADKSMDHPAFGILSLKNVADSIWLHEQRHIEQIHEIRQSLNV